MLIFKNVKDYIMFKMCELFGFICLNTETHTCLYTYVVHSASTVLEDAESY